MNVLKGYSIPSDRAESALNIIKENGRYAGIIRDTPTGPFVSLDSPGVPAPAATPATVEEDEWTETPSPAADKQQPTPSVPSPAPAAANPPAPAYDSAKTN